MTGTLAADVIGWAGAAGLLLAYAALSTGRLPAGRAYHLLNLAGSAGLALNSAVHRAWPSTALNVVWLGIGVVALVRARAQRAEAREPETRGPEARAPE